MMPKTKHLYRKSLSQLATGGFLVAFLLGISTRWTLEAATVPKKVKIPEIVALTPGYSLTDDVHDPFFPKKEEVKKGPTGPTAETLAKSLNIKGLMGTPDTPDRTGLLIGTKIYRVGSFIPVPYKSTVYSLVLVSVNFPGQIVLKYKDEVVHLTINKNTKKGN